MTPEEHNKLHSCSEETREKRVAAMRGKHHTEETKKKLSESHSGENNPMYGKDWNTIIDYINNKPSFFFDAPGCDTWIMPDPSVLSLISNSLFW